MAIEDERLLTRAEVAHFFRVDPRTVKRWEDAGKLERVPLPGRPRYLESEVLKVAASKGGNSS